ncbi:MAG: phosphoenolpyruvate carboxykinase, partial [bacterium]|nr:phosphoenolpyruvate carboxykinase [bacterium]
MGTQNQALKTWIDEMAVLAGPAKIVWLDGSEQEYRSLSAEAAKEGTLIPLNEKKNPGSYLHRSHPSDVARTEHCTFVCSL